ncbi:MAG: PAS domain S-box protein [Chroococcidiopsidaceae cyanobacterium CP_BM_RX_35]|nr:PAS domain S-box protein [Chroococcidiopsidaceae cyanobacterium CP_BM_RX_35]
MAEREHLSSDTNRDRYTGKKLCSGSPVAQEPLLLLAELASELSTASDFETLHQILIRKLRWIIDFDRCTLAVWFKPLDKEYVLFEITSPSRAKSTPPQKIPIEEGWSGRVLTDSKPYFIQNLAQLAPSLTMPLKAEWGIAPDTHSLMVLPLRIGERTIGSLNFSSTRAGAYSITWRNLTSLLAAQVGGQLGSVLSQMQLKGMPVAAPATQERKLKSAYEFRERVMESATDAIYTLDLEGKFTLVNQRTAVLTGYSVEELLGLSFLQLFYPQDATRIQAFLLATIHHGIATNQQDAELVRKDGSVKIVTFNFAPLFLEGKISAIVSTAQDTTERKQTESVLLRVKVAETATLTLERQVQERTLQLQQALDFEARLKRITDKVRDSLDESQIVQAAVKELALGLNVGCCNIALYNLEQGTSTICYEYAISIPASQGRVAHMANYPELYRQLLQNQYFQFCSIVPHPNRGRVAMLACPISDDQGVIGDLWLINQKNHIFHTSEIRLVQQVTNQCAIAIRQARLYQAATAQVAELEKLNRLKDDFLSTVSHELRTPISNMKLAIHMLQTVPAPEARERYLKILQNECTREAELINDLLDLQRLEAAAYTVSQEVVNLLDWLPNIIEPFRVRSQERQLLLHAELPPSFPPMISDSTSLGRILVELLNNACKYTPKGGKIALSVNCEPCPTATTVTSFTICNEAEIPAIELPRIFEKFYRVPGTDPWRQGGTGLGLALVQKLVERLRGTILVESSRGWTTFTVRLPNQSRS